MSESETSSRKESGESGGTLKQSVARTLKWNVIDRLSSQVLYLVTGVVLARELTQEEYGLVGAIQVFHVFASLFVDSGFAAVLLQRKSPTRLEYSTVLWFNVAMSLAIYMLLYILAPVIADLFQGDVRLIPLSRVMFLTFIINAFSIVQVNRLTKLMDTRMVAVSNSLGLVAGAVVGIYLAVTGYGAWALVWQAIVISVVKVAILWLTSGWTPLWRFSFESLRGFVRLGSGVTISSVLNTVFLTMGSFVIGHKVSLVTLGYYTQADKWSKMGVTSLSQVFTSSFVPLLSGVQDDSERYARMCGKTHRLAAYLLFPAMGLLCSDGYADFPHAFRHQMGPLDSIVSAFAYAWHIHGAVEPLWEFYVVAGQVEAACPDRNSQGCDVGRCGDCDVALYCDDFGGQCGVWSGDISLGAACGVGGDMVCDSGLCDTHYRPSVHELSCRSCALCGGHDSRIAAVRVDSGCV